MTKSITPANVCSVAGVRVGDREAVLLLDRELDLDDRERVEVEVGEGRVGVVRDVGLREPDPVDEDRLTSATVNGAVDMCPPGLGGFRLSRRRTRALLKPP